MTVFGARMMPELCQNCCPKLFSFSFVYFIKLLHVNKFGPKGNFFNVESSLIRATIRAQFSIVVAIIECSLLGILLKLAVSPSFPSASIVGSFVLHILVYVFVEGFVFVFVQDGYMGSISCQV